ncbi:hypothetical protein DDE18_20925 [Nocardioides gansuensis]|uniref:Uncharacterized protein n=1 Tax=Nocardioides gansuensis TaxID=2138300 RepID=A0A2T8F564_9ACTN|nr:hypothetical protein [Nocardioides gansuensis]PVG80851.1 hypothetical protein DDE18_20925 [Nocardioides gansuensis]
MTVPTWVAILLMVIGAVGIVRGSLIVAFGGSGRFRFDAALSLIAGFSLGLLGQYLHAQR